MPRIPPLVLGLVMTCLVVPSQPEGRTQGHAVPRQGSPANILFIILDDVGQDQLAAFNPAASTAALTPNLNAVAAAGVKFTSFTTTPQCSPSRAGFFTGRYSFRTGVDAAILDQDLPAAQVSPFEMTTPKVLSSAGYRSAMMGKYHLGGPENNPDGISAPVALGWDYFNGNLRGGPPPIDVTLGGQYTRDHDKYSCGFPTGQERGAVWFPVDASHARCDDNQGAGYTGQQGVALGGIPALDAQGDFSPTCSQAAGSAGLRQTQRVLRLAEGHRRCEERRDAQVAPVHDDRANRRGDRLDPRGTVRHGTVREDETSELLDGHREL